jgi:hypothetical protein
MGAKMFVRKASDASTGASDKLAYALAATDEDLEV